jgi:hypothetical protein
MHAYPKVITVTPLADGRLRITFDNGVCKLYDCKPLLQKPVFAPLANHWLFRTVQVELGDRLGGVGALGARHRA